MGREIQRVIKETTKERVRNDGFERVELTLIIREVISHEVEDGRRLVVQSCVRKRYGARTRKGDELLSESMIESGQKKEERLPLLFCEEASK
jgi:hypothetical protein